MTKDRPASITASGRQRLLNFSRQQNEDFQLILIRYALERLMFRMCQSPQRDQFVITNSRKTSSVNKRQVLLKISKLSACGFH